LLWSFLYDMGGQLPRVSAAEGCHAFTRLPHSISQPCRSLYPSPCEPSPTRQDSTRLCSHLWPPFARTNFLPETQAFGARLFDSLVNAVAALGVISLNGDSVLYTDFIIVPQFDRL
jgi:hypothetical protein